MKNIVVIAPHSDDETLGAGGYLLKHKGLGDKIYWVNVTNAKVEHGYTCEEVDAWNHIIQQVKIEMGFEEVFDLGFEPAGLDKLEKSKIVSEIKKVFDNIQPNVVLVPFYNDIHSDHRIVFEAAMACSKTFRCPSIEMILCMEIISETDYAVSDDGFVPNHYVDISEYIDKKIDILQLYDSEISNSPFPRNGEAIRGLAKYRGAACYCHYAEAFRIVKSVER